MKKLFYVFFLTLLVGNAVAQSCNSSGPTQCTATGTLTMPGLSPTSDQLSPFTNGIASTTVIQFKNFNTVFFSGLNLTVQSLRIDSIENLPAGLCWATDKANNTYANQESGCIKINGTPCGTPGQYKLRIIATVNVGITQQVNAETAGLKYFVRLGNYGDAVPAVDTLQTVALYTAGYSATANCSPVICPSFTFASSSTTNTSCAAPNGGLSVTASGGTAPYTYYLGSTNNTTGSFTNLDGGTYSVIAVDANQCRDTTNVTVSSTTPTISTSLVSSSAQTSCAGGNGSLEFTASGGAGPYTYSLGGNQNTTGIFPGLTAGGYLLTVTDTNSCSGTTSATVADSTASVQLSVAHTDASSSSATDGTATATASGGSSPYSYTWNNGQTVANATALAAGTYSVTAYDANSCSATASVVVGFTSSNGNVAADKLAVKVYPTPTADNIQIVVDLLKADKVTIELLKLDGSVVRVKLLSNATTVRETVSLTDLPKGTYLVRVSTGTQSTATPVVLQ